MKKTLVLLSALVLLLATTFSCRQQRSATEMASVSRPVASVADTNQAGQQAQGPQQAVNYQLAKAEAENIPAVPTERKIIRTGEFTLELDDPSDAQRKITTIAESLGGFVVTSESRLNDAASSKSVVNVVIRVPSAQFGAAVDKILGLGGRVLRRSIKGQDVTEEYIDLEARIRTKKALEAQFLEIMKQAHKISDAMEVQEKLADVRTQIEQLEGRRRFLDNQSSLSTINVTLQPPAPVVTASQSSFIASVRQAFGDGVDLAADIVLSLIRLCIIAVPIVGLIVLPAWFVWRLARRRFGWLRRTTARQPD